MILLGITLTLALSYSTPPFSLHSDKRPSTQQDIHRLRQRRRTHLPATMTRYYKKLSKILGEWKHAVWQTVTADLQVKFSHFQFLSPIRQEFEEEQDGIHFSWLTRPL